MDPAAILALYDQERRSGAEVSGMRREVTECTVRGIDLAGHQGWVTLTRLGDRKLDDLIRSEVEHFEALGQNFEWTVFEHEPPEDLKEQLVVRGFELDETESILGLDLHASPSPGPKTGSHELRRITNPEQVRDVVAVHEQVWGTDHPWLGRKLADDLRSIPEQLSVYVGYVEGVAACAGWIYFRPNRQFASLWGGSTLAAFRRRGLYTSLLAARMDEARERGVRFLTIDARSMSRPIAQKFGFVVLTRATGCLWRVRRGRTTGTGRSPGGAKPPAEPAR